MMYQIIIIASISLVLLIIIAFTRKKDNHTKIDSLEKVNVDEIKFMNVPKSMYGYETVTCKECGQKWDVTNQTNQDSDNYICPECRKKS